MDKGIIRPACNAKFMELLPQRAELGNTAFRKAVMDAIMLAFKCSLASAATHYNHSFKEVKKTNPELVVGLGRPENKKGGRKKKVVAEVVAANEEQQENTEANTDAAVAEQLYTVVKCKDQTVVAEGLTLAQATTLVERAAANKKAKLEVK